MEGPFQHRPGPEFDTHGYQELLREGVTRFVNDWAHGFPLLGDCSLLRLNGNSSTSGTPECVDFQGVCCAPFASGLEEPWVRS